MVTGSFSRACVHSACSVYIAEPSACSASTRRAAPCAQPMAAPVASGRPAPIAPPVICSQSCGARGVGVLEEAAAVADALVDDDRALRHHRGDAWWRGPPASARRVTTAGFGPLSGIAAAGAPSSSTSACSARLRRPARGAASTCSSAPSGVLRGRLARIGEEADRRRGVDQDQVLERRQRLHRGVGGIGHALERQAAAAALRCARSRARPSAGAGRRGDPPGEVLRRARAPPRRRAAAARSSSRAARARPAPPHADRPAAQRAPAAASATTPPSSQDASHGRISVAIRPAACARPARPRRRRAPTLLARWRGAHPGRDRRAPSLRCRRSAARRAAGDRSPGRRRR